MGPDRPFTHESYSSPTVPRETQLRATLTSADGTQLVAYQPVELLPVDKLPDPVKAPPKPEKIESLEELYLTGLRIEQIHNPRVDPMDYYLEALKRDAGDSRCNTMVGINYNRRGMYTAGRGASATGRGPIDTGLHAVRAPAKHISSWESRCAANTRYREAYEQFYRASLGSGLPGRSVLRIGCHFVRTKRISRRHLSMFGRRSR